MVSEVWWEVTHWVTPNVWPTLDRNTARHTHEDTEGTRFSVAHDVGGVGLGIGFLVVSTKFWTTPTTPLTFLLFFVSNVCGIGPVATCVCVCSV